MRLVVLAAVLALGAGAAGSSAARDTRGCAWGAIAAGNACLIEGHACEAQHTALYRRHGFACRAGILAYDWSQLRRRALAIPSLTPGAACPVSARSGTLAMFGLAPFPAWGGGPAYPAFDPPHADIRQAFQFGPEPEYKEWGIEKVMWAVDKRYVGPVLVRGHQLDGPNELRFENGSPGFTPEQTLHPATELRIVGGYVHPAVTRARQAGCYAYQADGIGFSRTIVFTIAAG
ncbi:MAG TPA: hypothetical protein VGO39_04445 [Gaiellaceae bacterium]|nr:hypothetical protein [Gaiellaceae bacterium]